MESWITEYWIWFVVAAAMIATFLAVMVIMSGTMRFLHTRPVPKRAEMPAAIGVEHDLAAAATAVEGAVLDLVGTRPVGKPDPLA